MDNERKAMMDDETKEVTDDTTCLLTVDYRALQKQCAQLAQENRVLREVVSKLRNGIAFVATAVDAVCDKYMPVE